MEQWECEEAERVALRAENATLRRENAALREETDVLRMMVDSHERLAAIRAREEEEEYAWSQIWRCQVRMWMNGMRPWRRRQKTKCACVKGPLGKRSV